MFQTVCSRCGYVSAQKPQARLENVLVVAKITWLYRLKQEVNSFFSKWSQTLVSFLAAVSPRCHTTTTPSCNVIMYSQHNLMGFKCWYNWKTCTNVKYLWFAETQANILFWWRGWVSYYRQQTLFEQLLNRYNRRAASVSIYSPAKTMFIVKEID